MACMGADEESFPQWDSCSLQGLNIEVRPELDKDAFPIEGNIRIPRYFYGEYSVAEAKLGFTAYPGYSEARALIGEGTTADLRRLSREVQDMMAKMSTSIRKDEHFGEQAAARPRVVQLRLAPELALWKSTQHALGNVLPPKGTGLSQASQQALAQLGATDWPEAMTTNDALFGCGIANMLMGAADVPTLFSNYVVDMAFYFEHGYGHVFPPLQGLLQDALADAHALGTPNGREHREAAAVGLPYIQDKIAMEVAHKRLLMDRSMRIDRRAAQLFYLLDSCVLGMGAEAIARGFDPAAVMTDLILSLPCHDVIDVGSDLVNSEVLNSILNVADIAATGVVSEPALRAIYDAYAATCSRMLTQRWQEPITKVATNVYTWQIQNDRHKFFRRVLMGWPMARKSPARPQREADFDEVFDTDFHTTGFSRPLDPEYACDGEEPCNHVRRFLDRQDEDLLGAFWWSLVTGPLEYVRQGKVDEEREEYLAESSRLQMAQLFSKGLIMEINWLIAHANQHAWQVNYMFEAAMFGSILDGGALIGQLDRAEQQDQEEGEEVDLGSTDACASEVLGSP